MIESVKHFITENSIINKEIKCQTFAIFEDEILVDPSDFEEENSSIITVIHILDDEQFILKKYDGKPLN